MSTPKEKQPSIDKEWLDLSSLTAYADVSKRTLGDWIRDTTDPLPAIRVNGKILVNKGKFDHYLENHTIKPSAVLDEIMRDLT